MFFCGSCSSENVKVSDVEMKDLSDFGLPVRVLSGGVRIECTTCGSESLQFNRMSELLSAAAVSMAFVPFRLNGSEVKFCRKAAGWTGKEAARILSVSAETISRWENDKQPVSELLEKIFRISLFSALRAKAPGFSSMRGEDIAVMNLTPIRTEKDFPALIFDHFASGSDLVSESEDSLSYQQQPKVAMG